MPLSLSQINKLVLEASGSRYLGPWEVHTEHDGMTGCFAIMLLNKDVMSVSNEALQHDDHGPYILFRHNPHVGQAPNSCACVDFGYLQIPRQAFVVANEMARGAAHLLSAQWAPSGCIYNTWTHFRCIWANILLHAVSPVGRPSRLKARIPDWDTDTAWPQHVAELLFLKLWQQADLANGREPATKPESGVPAPNINVINTTTRLRIDEIRALRVRLWERSARGQETDYLLWFAMQVKQSAPPSSLPPVPTLNPNPRPRALKGTGAGANRLPPLVIRPAPPSNAPSRPGGGDGGSPVVAAAGRPSSRRPSTPSAPVATPRPRVGSWTTSRPASLPTGASRPGSPMSPRPFGTCSGGGGGVGWVEEDPLALDVLAARLREEHERHYPAPERKGSFTPTVHPLFTEPPQWKNLTPSSRQALHDVARAYPHVDPAFYAGWARSEGLDSIRRKALEREQRAAAVEQQQQPSASASGDAAASAATTLRHQVERLRLGLSSSSS